MAHPDFKHIGRVQDRAIEEMAELTKVICKAERFGWDGHHPNKNPSRTNVHDAIDELTDVQNVLREFGAFLLNELAKLYAESPALPEKP